MHKNIGLVIATFLTAYISALTMSNQAFAQPAINIGQLGQSASNSGNAGHSGQLGIVILAGHEAQLGKELAGHATKSALGDVCLSCWGGLAAHDAQLGKELAGQITSNVGSGCTPLEREEGLC